ncbi:DUF4389 domain-containing protein [Streptomyces sp. Root1310]|uniref:DUF4389 domain-containing protein n=1 Tax=Streptomyces sp. Root1310 TaxID=1736452 RepID=UPI00070923B7|nr:DUF4389 domain-containing protein [Streptomyces sp. Root1310]KQX71152.1 hypothetical protein ASD48_12185 [Streptomyces sp. Root1310]
MIPVAVSPVRIEAFLDPRLSRWMWLVKWFLAIPHYIVLFFLWIAFSFVTFVAFFAILFTARYPRALFDFNVGVMRWNWRVAYYAHAALGTDRYPPFTLAEVPDYPAHFDVVYPERLSRGLVLVKWWLLAIPQYIVVGMFVGDWGWGWGGTDGWHGGGLVFFLSFVAVIILAFTGRYPVHLFDFLLGLARWVARVGAYAALMTDAYPPFRLDMGAQDSPPAEPQAPVGGPGR